MIEPDNVFHLYPKDEEDDHTVFLTYPEGKEPHSDCECEPWFKMQDNGILVVVHSRLSGKKAINWANEILNNK